MEKRDYKELQDLLATACDGQLSNTELSRMDAQLQDDSIARELWLSFSRLHVELSLGLASDRFLEKSIAAIRNSMYHPAQLVGESFEDIPLSCSISPKPVSAAFNWGKWLAPLAATLVVFSYLMFLNMQRTENFAAVSEAVGLAVGEWSNSTYCAWSGSENPSTAREKTIYSGEKFSLLQGVAHMNLANGVSLLIDGPAALVVASESSIVLQYGSITGKMGSTTDSFEIEIPSGSLNFHPGEFGVKVDGKNAEVHAFTGFVVANLTPFGNLMSEPDFLGTEVPDELVIEEGSAVELLTAKDSLLLKSRITADRNSFATTLPETSPLNIPEDYVKEVNASQPVAYWRFDPPIGGGIANEIAADNSLMVKGNVQFHSDRGNSVAEFGSAQDPGYLLSEQPLSEMTGLQSYTVECWLRPSHYQHGFVVGLMDSPHSSPHSGVAIELCPGLYSPGPSSGRIRFLHRSPPSGSISVGTSAFSENRYQLRHWQHLVAVKDGGQLRMFVNGKLSATASEETVLVGQLHVMCGLLVTSTEMRTYVGQLDELAIYLRPLSGEEVRKHYHAAPQQEHLQKPIQTFTRTKTI